VAYHSRGLYLALCCSQTNIDTQPTITRTWRNPNVLADSISNNTQIVPVTRRVPFMLMRANMVGDKMNYDIESRFRVLGADATTIEANIRVCHWHLVFTPANWPKCSFTAEIGNVISGLAFPFLLAHRPKSGMITPSERSSRILTISPVSSRHDQ
jgi:hypothetical protein